MDPVLSALLLIDSHPRSCTLSIQVIPVSSLVAVHELLESKVIVSALVNDSDTTS
jgi:hypothetical protein